MQNIKDIVSKAWRVTQQHLKSLIWYGSVPAFFTVLVSSVYIGYQYNAFRHSALFGNQSETDLVAEISRIWELVKHHPKLTLALVVVALIVFVGYVLSPPVFRGTLIYALNQIEKEESIEGSFQFGVRQFFPLFEFGVVTGSFSIVTLFSESSFILRWWGENIFFVALPILLFIAMVGLIASFLFTYAEYFIVLKGLGLIESIKESALLVIGNLKKTILVFVLMLLIGARVIVNVLLVLFIPMGLIVVTSYFATIFFTTAGFIIIGIFSILVLLVAAYLMGLFNIFTTAVWVFAFNMLTEHEITVAQVHHSEPVPAPEPPKEA
ncbi:hypothetical protein IPJ72_05540 [Candidatus Peregrinibacteria bacterium]|nr:MAG: hypothetical protein IPJ72_05540 [Candidatus Peregrinibacteria bacterium]